VPPRHDSHAFAVQECKGGEHPAMTKMHCGLQRFRWLLSSLWVPCPDNASASGIGVSTPSGMLGLLLLAFDCFRLVFVCFGRRNLHPFEQVLLQFAFRLLRLSLLLIFLVSLLGLRLFLLQLLDLSFQSK